MSTQELVFNNLETAVSLYGDKVGNCQPSGVNFSQAFGNLLRNRLNEITPETHPKSLFKNKLSSTVKNKNGMYVSYIYEMLDGKYRNPDPNKCVKVLIHYGINGRFLTDLESWNKWYIIEDVPLEYIDLFCESEISNAADLAAAFKTGDFDFSSYEEEEE